MSKAATILAHNDPWCESYRSIVSELMCLIAHVEASIELIESATAREPAPVEVDAEFVVLDDVTPRYVKANAALESCRARLGVAVNVLRMTKLAECGTDKAADRRFEPRRVNAGP